jgi:hypothetical protein
MPDFDRIPSMYHHPSKDTPGTLCNGAPTWLGSDELIEGQPSVIWGLTSLGSDRAGGGGGETGGAFRVT